MQRKHSRLYSVNTFATGERFVAVNSFATIERKSAVSPCEPITECRSKGTTFILKKQFFMYFLFSKSNFYAKIHFCKSKLALALALAVAVELQMLIRSGRRGSRCRDNAEYESA